MSRNVDEPTVLVVDDDEDWRVLLDMHLADAEGINLIGVVRNASAAVGVLEQLGSFAGASPAVMVVVVDVRMPGMNGIDLAAHLLKNKPDIRVVLFSSYVDEDAMFEARTLGVHAVVSKLELKTLPDVIREVAATC
jgi:two-component system, NarL family, response regulator DevR